MSARELLRLFTPPLLWSLAKRLRAVEAEYTYAPQWVDAGGWDTESVVASYNAGFSVYERAADTPCLDRLDEKTYLAFAYGLYHAALGKPALSMLDWGGAIGQYRVLAQALLRDISLDYHCKDVPRLVEAGRARFPDAVFYDDESCLERGYDFVLVSGSLQFCRDWKSILAKLAQSTAGYLLITRLPVVEHAATYAAVQRAYGSEWTGWVFNRAEFLAAMPQLRLIRELSLTSAMLVAGAPEMPMQKAFLFERTSPR